MERKPVFLIEELGDSSYENILSPIWDYLVVKDKPQVSDAIFVFGGLDLKVPQKAAKLYLAGFAPVILITGGFGPLTKDTFSMPEAKVFFNEMVKLGVPKEDIIIEEKATNTLQNVILGMEMLKKKNIKVNQIILVAKPFLMRRCRATFQKHYPRITTICCPPEGSIFDFIDRPKKEFAKRLLDEIERIKVYSEKGDIIPQILPDTVKTAIHKLKKLLEL